MGHRAVCDGEATGSIEAIQDLYAGEDIISVTTRKPIDLCPVTSHKLKIGTSTTMGVVRAETGGLRLQLAGHARLLSPIRS